MPNHPLFKEQEKSGNGIGDYAKIKRHHTTPSVFVDAENASEYRMNKGEVVGNRSTQLPISTPEGGIEGGGNRFGVILPGVRYGVDADGNQTILGKNDPPIPEELTGKTAEETSAGGLTVDTPTAVVPAQIVPAAPVKGRKSRQAQQIQELQAALQPILPAPVKEEKLKVTLSGAFGEYTGNYVYVTKTRDDLIVLVQDVEENGFLPPISDENEITVSYASSTGQAEYKACYLGIAFPLPTYGIKLTVMHLV